MGPGTLNIAGPNNSSGTVGTDQNGIVYTETGFATPFINIGPTIDPLNPGAIGGWVIGPTGTLGQTDYDLTIQQKTAGTSVPAGLVGPRYSLIKATTLGYVGGNTTYVAPTGLITTTVGTSETRIYEVGPITTLETTKLMIMANASLISGGHTIELTVGRATSSGENAANSINVVAGASPLVLPATTTCYYMAAFPGGSNNDAVNLHGFVIDAPGAGTFYYTIWMSSSTSHTYGTMTATLSILKI